jgi:multicomponent Na+:H+ antiporter subunit C
MRPASTFLVVGLALVVLGVVRTLLTEDLVRRVLGFNVAGAGVLLVLGSLAARGEEPDPVPQALVLTGIVVTISITAVALGLVRRIEQAEQSEQAEQAGEVRSDPPT